jgi:hypothetical protein
MSDTLLMDLLYLGIGFVIGVVIHKLFKGNRDEKN